MRSRIIALLIGWESICGAQSIPSSEAAGAFAMALEISDRDAGRTWGIPVCGPMLLADADTRDVVANQADAEGRLQRDAGGVFTGKLPKEVHVSNTALEWAGVRWTMVMWPLPAETRRRAQLLAHECFHRIQPALKHRTDDVVNAHLDGKDGRSWLLLEWRALERAILERGEARRKAIADALRFRVYRRSLIPAAGARESALERNEGLAEYTGVRLANADGADRRGAAVFMLRDGPGRASFVRSFAYVSGPAYGVLLDESGRPWRKELKPDADLGDLLGRAYGVAVTAPDEASALAAARPYGGDAVLAAETLRGVKLEKRLADARRRFVDGPVVVLPVMGKLEFGFNPNDLVPLDDQRTVYPWLRVSDEWGVLEANGGMLVREGGLVTRVVVPAHPKGSEPTGADWKLDLKPGFTIRSGTRPGDEVVVKE